jgi:hypothetical protein
MKLGATLTWNWNLNMRISDAFPSRYLRTAGVKVATVCTIRGVVMEQLMDVSPSQ